MRGSQRERMLMPNGAGPLTVADRSVALVCSLSADSERFADLGPRGAGGERARIGEVAFDAECIEAHRQGRDTSQLGGGHYAHPKSKEIRGISRAA